MQIWLLFFLATKPHGEATKLVSDLKKLLETKSINGGVKVNDLVKDFDFINLLNCSYYFTVNTLCSNLLP